MIFILSGLIGWLRVRFGKLTYADRQCDRRSESWLGCQPGNPTEILRSRSSLRMTMVVWSF